MFLVEVLQLIKDVAAPRLNKGMGPYGQQAVERLIIGWRTRMIQKMKKC